MDNQVDTQRDSTNKRHQESQWLTDSPIVMIDNGSGTIKAGFAGESSPRHFLSNCGAQPVGGKRGASGLGHQQQLQSSSQLLIGDDIFLLPDYFCLRPFQYGLLTDPDLQIAIWERLFSKAYLNITDPSSYSLIVTEQFNTPTSSRHLLQRIIFEHFGFSRMVISPAQQLVPFAFTSSPPSVPVDLWSPTSNHPTSSPSPGNHKDQARSAAAKRQRVANGRKKLKESQWASVTSTVVGDCYNPRSSPPTSLLESYCQLVVDVGHQATWIVPMYGELPLDIGVLRIDLGGTHASSLLKNLLGYQKINLERNELLTHHIKEESCFVSLNYLQDLKQLKSQLGRPSNQTYLTHHYLLPDFNTKEKSALKQFFRTSRSSRVPTYIPEESEGASVFQLSVDQSWQTDLRQMMRVAKDEHSGYLDSFGTSLAASTTGSGGLSFDAPSRHPSEGIGMQSEQTSVGLNVERIAPAELFFNPQDHDFRSSTTPAAWDKVFVPSSSPSDTGTTKALQVAALQPPNPAKQASLAEAIERSIFNCPPVLQPLLASKILLCGGSSTLCNFSRRLYCELRPLLPKDWFINIYQLNNPSATAWIGASVWSSENNSANYHTFCVNKSDYLENGSADVSSSK